jgi:hypothetical protein
VPTWKITSCLREYRDEKWKGFPEKSTCVRESTSGASALAEVPTDPTARPGHTGASSGQYFLRGLRFGRSKLKSPIRLEDIKLSLTLDGGQAESLRPAESTTLFIVTALEAFLLSSGTSIVQSHLAAAYLFLCYACMRCKQSTDCWITGIVEGEFVEGFVACEKNPKRGKRFPRPWWASLYVATGSRLWIDTLVRTLHDVRDDCYIFRAFFSRDNSVLNATELAPGPLRCGAEMTKVMRQILEIACGWSVPQASLYTEHSPRHFLNEVAKAREETPACRQEVGRWSSSVVQMSCMRPVSGSSCRHKMTVSVMPDTYSQGAEKRSPLAILRRQMAKVRKVVSELGHDLPMYGVWHNERD